MTKSLAPRASVTIYCERCETGRSASIVLLTYLEARGLAFEPWRELLRSKRLTCQTCRQPSTALAARLLTDEREWVERWAVVDGRLIQTAGWTPPAKRHGAAPS